jgi:quinol monooxygenase YgiN
MKFSNIFTRVLAAICLALILPNPAEVFAASWSVSYFETRPDAEGAGRGVLAEYIAAVRLVEGNNGVAGLQQDGRENQFVVIEEWTSNEAREAHAAGQVVAGFRESLAPGLISGYDERVYTGPGDDGGLEAGPGAVFVVTHIDIGSRPRETGIDLVRKMVERGTGDAGNLRMLLLSWSMRDNHMTVLEVWENTEAHHHHLEEDYMKDFRIALTPLIGAMYDERVYFAVGASR